MGSPPRFPKVLPRGPELWDPSKTKWTERNTGGIWVCEFTQATMRLTKGAARGQLVVLRHWQGDLISDILRYDRRGRRLYRTYEVFISRKNSKSLLGAALALDGLFDEPGAEVYSCAGDKDQAKLVFNEVVEAVAMSPELGGPTGKKGLLTVYRDAIEYPKLGSVYRAVSSESRLREGMNPSRNIFDEKHVQKNDDLWNVMNQGSDTRDQPLTVTFTTKGVMTYTDGTPTICKRGYDYARKVIAGELDDPTYGCRLYETVGSEKPGFDYLDEKNWYPSNPALGDFLHLEHMRTRGRQMPENDFKTKRLNIWVTHKKAWLPGGAFERLAKPGRLPIPGENAVLALDGSFDQDSTALIAWLLGGDKPHLTVVGVWERPDDADGDWKIPVAEVEAAIIAAARGELVDPDDPDGDRHPSAWQVLGVWFDLARWQRTAMVLEEDGLPVRAFPQTADRMVPATTEMFTAVMEQAFTHDGRPELERHFRNATTKTTSRGTMLARLHRAGKIDLAVASVFGRAAALYEEGDDSPSVYEDRGLVVL